MVAMMAGQADFSSIEFCRLYMLWVVSRFDKYLPLIDCDRQAAKAQYFHDCGRYTGMSGWHYRYVNPKAWLILFMRKFSIFLFPALAGKGNAVVNKP